MFGTLSKKFQAVFSHLSGKKTLTESNIADAVRDVRSALLEADVHYAVAHRFVEKVKEKALGSAVLKAVSPAQKFVKLIHEELVALMGADEATLYLKGKLSILMLCGLQGAGKTTTCAKLAAYIGKKEKGKKILLAACDLQRPAAVEQLKKLGSEVGVPVFIVEGEKSALNAAKQAHEKAQAEGFDVLIVDTAGRLHLDEVLMAELAAIKALLQPQEVLFVANAATGQDAVRVATEFNQKIEITGTILTMLDGDARAGAALSIREATQKPLKFEGCGERITDLQLFHPQSMADRILGMGDVINLVKKAEEHIDQEERKRTEEKIRKGSLTYSDYLKQMKAIKRMGSFQGLLKMLPGMDSLGEVSGSEQELGEMEAVILSMTPGEREEKEDLSFSRRRRIERGSGVSLEKINRMVKRFKQLKDLLRKMPDMKGFSGMKDLKQQFKRNNYPWR